MASETGRLLSWWPVDWTAPFFAPSIQLLLPFMWEAGGGGYMCACAEMREGKSSGAQQALNKVVISYERGLIRR